MFSVKRFIGCCCLLLVWSCGGADMVDNPQDATENDELSAMALAGITVYPTKEVCSGGTYKCKSHVRIDESGAIQAFAAAATSGFGPSDLASAYHLSTSLSPGATIAIVDAYGYTKAASDLATYRSHYGLPACTVASGCLKIVNQNGATSPLPSQPSASDDWTVETALDLDMASSACPNCKLLLIQANDDTSDGLFIANNTAATLGATVVSNSWGGSMSGSEPSYEHYFNHSGVGYFVASGDSGYTGSSPDYPSTSAYVTGVGGTTLKKATSTTRGWTETAWSSAGSSCSKTIAKPSYQGTTGCSYRAAADVSAVANPSTGLAVYNNGPSSSGWIVVGGTSASSPFVAGVYALYGKGAVGPSFSYANTSYFYDVTSGKNGSCSTALCKAGKGWDGPTGNGTPNGTVF
jgi:subtilase family serine protease